MGALCNGLKQRKSPCASKGGAGRCINPDLCVGRLGLGIVQGGLAAYHDSPCGGLNGKLVYCHQNHQRPTVSLQSADMARERQGTPRKPIFWP